MTTGLPAEAGVPDTRNAAFRRQRPPSLTDYRGLRYSIVFLPVEPQDALARAPTQMAVFELNCNEGKSLMKLQDYVSAERTGEAEQGCQGKQTEWLDLYEIKLSGPQFLVVDASFVPSAEDGLLIEAPPGQYEVRAKCIDYGGDARISRLRVSLKGTQPELGPELGKTWTDTAMTGCCDYEVFLKAWGNDDEASYEKISGTIEESDSHGIAVLAPGTEAVMPFVRSGFGDGSYQVFELLDGTKRAGFEIEFISESERYPFPPSPAALARKLKAAAEKGDADAQWRLGECYREGEGGNQDFKEAFKWHSLASENGHAEAAFRLGTYFGNGHGVEKDLQKAKEMYELAASRGSANAVNNLGRAYHNGLGVPKDLAKAAAHYLEAAEKGNAAAQCNIAIFYHMGTGVAQNMEQAIKWYRLAADQHQPVAECHLGHCYLEGLGVPKDAQKAVHFFQHGAISGHATSQYNLGYCYETGQGIEQDFAKAVTWYRKAASRELPVAQTKLAVLMKKGQGTQKNLPGAVDLFRKAAEKGFAEAQYHLGLLHEIGEGVTLDPIEACKWFQKAAASGEKEASEHLNVLLAKLTGAQKTGLEVTDCPKQ
ncbi:MAG TPA: SEL1-like repeat protein [Verrucomicrobiae bacterium]|nr:SEL1-like repeat protein [Verrucomicrobiae bacterium]